MENKINISLLAGLISEKTNRTRKICEDFIKELFSIVGDELTKGEQVRIKGFGTFKLIDIESRKSVDISTGEEIEIPAHSRVIFVPAKELSSVINQPFAIFDSVELSDEIPLESIEDNSDIDLPIEEGDSDEPSKEEPENHINNDNLSALAMLINGNEGLKEEAEADENVEDDLLEDEIDEREQYDLSDTELDYDEIEYIEAEEAEDLAEGIEMGVNPEIKTEIENFSQQLKEGAEGDLTEQRFDEQSSEEDLDDEATSEAYLYQLEEDKTVSEKPSSQEVEGEEVSKLSPSIEESLPVYMEEEPKRKTFFQGFVSGFLSMLIIGAAFAGIGYYFEWFHLTQEKGISEYVVPSEESNSMMAKESPVSENQSEDLNKEEIQKQEAPVYDTVSTTRYLTTIAREHYGNFNLWPIIYEENQSILGHPDRIKPGTQVVVPPLSKYGIDPNNKEDIERIKKKAAEIYSRFK